MAEADMFGIDPDDDSLIGRDLSDVPEEKWAPLLVQMIEVLQAMHVRQGRSEDGAFKLASDSVIELAHYLGARVFYLPRGDRIKIAMRDAEIHHRWRLGARIDRLATDYRLSEIHLYRILSQQRALHIKKTQRELPFEINQTGE